MKYLRVQPAAADDSQPRIDYKAGVIRGVSIIQAVEALGHGVMVDATTLGQVATQINAKDAGVQSRFTHPGMCDDGVGSYLGRVTNATVKGDKVVADLTLSQRAKNSPKGGDLYSYVMGLAEEAPEDFGISVAVVPDTNVWTFANGSEMPVNDPSLYDKKTEQFNRPADALTAKPVLRVKQLRAADVVGEPAANRDGLFSATSSALSDETFQHLDTYLSENGIDTERAFKFAMRYFARRGLDVTTAGQNPAQPHKGNVMKPEELKALKAKHPDHAGLIVDMFADGKGEAEILAAIETATREAKTAELAAKVEKVLALAEKERADAKAALQAKDDQIKKLSEDLAKAEKVAALGKGAPGNVGGLETDETGKDEAALLKKWDTDADLRAKFFNEKDTYLALARLEAQNRDPKFHQVTRINAANVMKPISGEEA